MSRKWLVDFLRKVGVIEDFWDKGPDDLYLRIIKLSPSFSFGKLRLHYFFRGDRDPDPHDHMWDFVTIPLCWCGYLEQYVDQKGVLRACHVKGFRPAFRSAEHVHQVVGRYQQGCVLPEYTEGPFATLIWKGRKRREWGFWPFYAWALGNGLCEPTPAGEKTPLRVFVPFKAYIRHKAQVGSVA